MTKIIFDIKRDNGYGKMTYPIGVLNWMPNQRNSNVIINQLQYQLGGPIEIELEPTNGVYYWGVTENNINGVNVISYYRNVEIPDSDKPIKYEDLPDVDPETFFNEA